MITLQLSPGDIEKVRFAYSPLIEVSASFKVYQRPELHPLYQVWIDEIQPKFERVDFPFMHALILPHGYIADFLTPTPPKTILSLEDEIERMRQTPDEVIRKYILQVVAMAGISPTLRLFLEQPREALECLIEEVRFYWQQALEPHWAQVSAILERDVLFRARALALDGIDAMLLGLAEQVDYHRGALRVHKDQKHPSAQPPAVYHLKGEGIQLVPSVFASCSGSWQVVPEWLPMLIYQARGRGLWQHGASAEPNEALGLTLGASRARLLQTLIEPAHTNDLAQRLSLTAGAVSQQLGRLSQAGLIDSYRSGSKVYYRLSPRGEHLLDLFAG